MKIKFCYFILTADPAKQMCEVKRRLDMLVTKARALCDEGEWEAALNLYREGLKVRPNSMECRAGEQRAINVIKNHLADNLKAPPVVGHTPVEEISILPTDDNIDYSLKADGPEFKELCPDLTHQNDEGDDANDELEQFQEWTTIGRTSKEASKKTLKQKTHEDLYWDGILKTLEQINDPSKLVQSTYEYLQNLEILNIFERDKVPYKGKLYYLLMRGLIELSDFKQAEYYKTKLLEIADDILDEELKIKTLYLEGRILALEGHYERAAHIFQELLGRTTYPERMAHLLHEMGRCYFKTDEINTAKMYGMLSLEAANEALSHVWLRNASLLLAQVETVQGCINDALAYYETAETAARRLNDQQTLVYIICETQKLGKPPRRPKIKDKEVVAESAKCSPANLRRPKLPVDKYIK